MWIVYWFFVCLVHLSVEIKILIVESSVNMHELTNLKLSALKIKNSSSINLCNHKLAHLGQLQASIFTAFVSYL